jgi:flagellar basal-body rod protein FlgG
MESQQVNIDTIANNIANVNTTGFKQSRAEFQDLLYQNVRPAGASASSSTQYPVGLRIGLGSRPSATSRNHKQGDFRKTDGAMDVVIAGKGFFQVRLPTGETAYTRDGSLKTNQDGTIVTADGDPIEPQITIPLDALEVTIGGDGTVTVTQQGQSTPQTVGTIQLATFQNPGGLNPIGRNLFLQTSASGDPITANPGDQGLGRLQHGYLEQSNVNVVEEMVAMIIAQRAYEVNSRAIRVADDMMSQVNNLVR